MKFFGVVAFLVVVAVASVAADTQGVDVEQIISTCTCGYSYKPICGSDSYTYANQCIFDCVQKDLAGKGVVLNVAHHGPCSA